MEDEVKEDVVEETPEVTEVEESAEGEVSDGSEEEE